MFFNPYILSNILSSQLHTYTAQAILAIHKFNIQFLRPNNNWPIPLPTTPGTPVDSILSKASTSISYLKEQLNIHNITCIEQFTNHDNTRVLNWKQFH